MKNVDSFLKKLELSQCTKKYSVLIASLMFLWSGVNKINHFDKKVAALCRKTNFDCNIAKFGMVNVILLEIFGFIFLIEYFFKKKYLFDVFKKINKVVDLSQKQLIQIILLLVLLFLIIVTAIYHPPNFSHPIPFLSNLTTFGLFSYVYSDLFNC